ncbi:uncharacterized protein CDV56_101288 [Aspergillus thermomutatus]|uniref:C2H2-type domain-containing protein n=1 Tax=Aspergillus thermomutatus TaxID=41047 RepID=A0A397HJT3_ASPTH|nr:uncharacterized protein CDV56_101288 [Aspergillus thermomutatus]RHZ60680.1 hypothetical protein CDV56_101288 [Aspergillus thermomutatus]
MEQSSERGITPGNEDGPSLFTFPLPAPIPVDPLPAVTFTSSPESIQSYDSVDSELGRDGGESPEPTIHGQEDELYDIGSSSRPAFPHDSHGKHEFDAHLDTSKGISSSQTYLCDLCDESARRIFYSFDDLRTHKCTRHETTGHIQQLSPLMPNEAVSKLTNQLHEPSTSSEPGYNSQVSSNASVSPSQRIAFPSMSKGHVSPLGSESTDSGDTEMHADEESLFDDQDAHLYTGRRWDEETIQRLEHIYKQKLYSLVDSQVLQRCNAYQAHGTSSGHVSACSSRSGVPRKRTRIGCLTLYASGVPLPTGYYNHELSQHKQAGPNKPLLAPRPLPLAATEQPTSNATSNAGVQEINLQGRDGTSSGRNRKAEEISAEDDHSDPYDGDGDGSQEPSKRFKASKSEDRALRFACPSDHENSSRVKQHISRKHRMPIYCPRCSEIFKTEHERDTHVRDADCPVGPKANLICATTEQLRKLSRRNIHQSDRENWNAIYKILFPDDPLPESPYLDPLVSYEVNLVREAFLTAAPVAVRTAIQHVIPEEISDTLQEELERVLRSTHAEVFDQILRRMRDDREAARVRHTTAPSLLQVGLSSTPDSGIGSTVRSGSSQDEPEPILNSQDGLTSFDSASFYLQNDGAIPLLPSLTPPSGSPEYHIGDLSQILPDGSFGDLSEYLDAPGDSFFTDQS